MAFERSRRIMRWIMAIFYLAAGIVHLRAPEAFMPIMPAWVPSPHFVILATGLCEIAGATGLLLSSFRWWAGVMLALYAVCVFPANIKHAFDHVTVAGMQLNWWYHGPRLALQPVLVWWALFSACVIDWPWKQALRPVSKR